MPSFSQRTELEILIRRFNNIEKYIGLYKGSVFLTSSTGIYPQDQKLIDETTYPDSELSSNMVYVENMIKKFSTSKYSAAGRVNG